MIRDAETLKVLLDSVERFVQERLVPAENEVAETDVIPADIVADMKAMGLFGLTLPEAYGGLGVTMEEEVMVMLAMGKPHRVFDPCLEPPWALARWAYCSMARRNKKTSTCRAWPVASAWPPSR